MYIVCSDLEGVFVPEIWVNVSRHTGIDWLRTKTQLIVVSDTFTEFADPLIRQLGRPTLLCHHLTTNSEGVITDYNLRQEGGKMHVVEAPVSYTHLTLP